MAQQYLEPIPGWKLMPVAEPPVQRLEVQTKDGTIEIPLGHEEPLPLTIPVFRALRKLAGLTQQEVADALEVTQATVSRWEAGKQTMPTNDRLMLRFVRALAPWKLFQSNLGHHVDIGGRWVEVPSWPIYGKRTPQGWPTLEAVCVYEETAT